MRIRILPYKIGSASGRLLASALGGLRVRSDGNFRPRAGDVIINWGSGRLPSWWGALTGVDMKLLNYPANVAHAANKLHTFQRLQAAGVSIPTYYTQRNQLAGRPETFYARQSLTGHSGRGIVVLRPGDNMVDAPLYTQAIENHGEYRVHVVNGEVIDYIKKRRRNNEPATNEQNQVRNLANGWIYTRENLRRLDRIEALAIRAVAALGLDFGAVDIIMDENGDVFVLEVNTACGMSESTLLAYTEAFNRLIESYA